MKRTDKEIEREAMEAAIRDEEHLLVDAQAPEVEAEADVEAEPEVEASEGTIPTEEVPAVPERVEVMAGYTKDELEAKLKLIDQIPQLRKGLDTTNGTWGKQIQQLNKTIEALSSQLSQQKQVSEEVKKGFDLKNLGDEYPDLAARFSKDLSEEVISSIVKQFPQQRVDPEEIKALVMREFESRELGKGRARLQKEHPDFDELAGYVRDQDTGVVTEWKNEGFRAWLSTQPQSAINIVLQSDDPDDISAVITAYKKYSSPEDQTDSSSKELKAATLARAILPQGKQGGSARAKSSRELELEGMIAAYQED